MYIIIIYIYIIIYYLFIIYNNIILYIYYYLYIYIYIIYIIHICGLESTNINGYWPSTSIGLRTPRSCCLMHLWIPNGKSPCYWWVNQRNFDWTMFKFANCQRLPEGTQVLTEFDVWPCFLKGSPATIY